MWLLKVLNIVNPATSPQYILCGVHPPKFYTGSAAPIDTIVKAIEAGASDLPPKKILLMERKLWRSEGRGTCDVKNESLVANSKEVYSTFLHAASSNQRNLL